MEKSEDLVKKELWKFVQKQCPECVEEFHSAVDEIVLSYMVSILEDLGSENSSEDAFDVDSFTEMMEAYLPGFAQIDSVQTSEWMFELASKLTNSANDALSSKCTEGDRSDELAARLAFPSADDSSVQSEQYSGPVCRSRSDSSRTSSTSESGITCGSKTKSSSSRHSSLSETDIQNVNCETIGGQDSEGELEDDEHVKLLLEMFPSACSMEVAHCLCVANGDVEGAAQLILHRQETGECVTEKSKSQHKKAKRKKTGTTIIGDNEMKKHIIQRYSYVDTEDDKKEHRPIAPKNEPKKMVRYLDGRVVSTKGERFTEIKKDEGDDMKKTYVNLKPARQYRFH